MNKRILATSLLMCLWASATAAHPGRTASDGCHYCRTNCDYWGVPYGARHCHIFAEPTEEDLNHAKVVKEFSEHGTHFITLRESETWLTFETTSKDKMQSESKL